MTSIIRREFSAYFASPIGYIFLAVFWAFAGYFLFIGPLYNGTADMVPIFGSMFTIVMFLIPIITMRLISEDRRQKTDQLLLTSPLSLYSLVAGKLLAASVMYLSALSITLVYALVMQFFAVLNWSIIIANFIGMFLLGTALISIGMFISSMTENQVIAAACSFAVMIMLLLLDTTLGLIGNEFLQQIAISLSFFQHYINFMNGLFDLKAVLFFISVIVMFSYLTVRVFEKRRVS
jgi:ABC-2 type transport system permease protein